MTEPAFVVLGVVTSAHGVRGAVKIKPFTQFSDDILAYGRLHTAQGEYYDLKLLGEAKGQLIGQFPHITDRNQAEKLRGLELGVLRSALPDLPDDTFYINDMVGMHLVDEAGAMVGEVLAVSNFGAGDVVELRYSNGQTEFLPFNSQIFGEIDATRRLIQFMAPDIARPEADQPKDS